MFVSRLRHIGLRRNLLHQLESLSIRGCHQSAVCSTTSVPQTFAHNLGDVHSGLPVKTLTRYERYVEDTFCISQNNTSTIGDRVNSNIIYKCPKTSSSIVEITTPSSVKHILPLETPGLSETEQLTPGFDTIEKLADAAVMRIRRRGMKKHRRKKLMKKIWPILRKNNYLKMQKKMKSRQRWVDGLKKRNESLNPLDEIKEKLNCAVSKGFKINIFNDSIGSKFIDDVRKKKEIEQLKSFMQSARKANRQS